MLLITHHRAMTNLVQRIIRSLLALPPAVMVWMVLILIPANLSGFALLDTNSGKWIAVLGGGALGVNTILVLLNGGFSRVLAVPHLVFWVPLEIVLLYRHFTAEMGATEAWVTFCVLIINAISLVFDVVDTQRWYGGERDVIGFEGQPVRL